MALTLLALYHGGTGAYDATVEGLALVRDRNLDSYGMTERRQFEYIREELVRQVPLTTTIYVAEKDPLWQQRLAEVAAMKRYRLAGEHQAHAHLFVVKDSAAPQGVRLVVQRVR